jgi:hypothetical protein
VKASAVPANIRLGQKVFKVEKHSSFLHKVVSGTGRFEKRNILLRNISWSKFIFKYSFFNTSIN